MRTSRLEDAYLAGAFINFYPSSDLGLYFPVSIHRMDGAALEGTEVARIQFQAEPALDFYRDTSTLLMRYRVERNPVTLYGAGMGWKHQLSPGLYLGGQVQWHHVDSQSMDVQVTPDFRSAGADPALILESMEIRKAYLKTRTDLRLTPNLILLDLRLGYAFDSFL